MSDNTTWAANWKNIVDKAWSDPSFHAQLLTDTTAALAGEGITLPANATVQVVLAPDAYWRNGSWHQLPNPTMSAVLYLPPIPKDEPEVGTALDGLEASFKSATACLELCC